MAWDEQDEFDEYQEEPDDDFAPRRSTLYARPNRERETELWNGQPVRRMDSDHLMNAILFCERKFAVARNTYVDCHRDKEDNFYFATVYDMFPNYKYLRNEWERRKNDG